MKIYRCSKNTDEIFKSDLEFFVLYFDHMQNYNCNEVNSGFECYENISLFITINLTWEIIQSNLVQKHRKLSCIN